MHMASETPIGGYIEQPCDVCFEGPLQRIASFTFTRPLQEHFNHTVGAPISSNRQFDDELKKLSEKDSERHGVTQTYERVDPTDKAALGVTEEGMDATNKRKRDGGWVTPSSKIIHS